MFSLEIQKLNNVLDRIGGPAVKKCIFFSNKSSVYYEWWINNKQVEVYYICG